MARKPLEKCLLEDREENSRISIFKRWVVRMEGGRGWLRIVSSGGL
jgi:hypothetical protein